MISGLKPYPAYKPSGVEWLGEVPKRWEVRRLRTAVAMRVSNVDKHVREGETPVRLCNYVDVYKHDCISQRIDFMRATATPEEVSQFRLEEGDVLITKDSEAWDDIGVPAVVTEPADDLISGYHLALLRPIADVLTGGYLLRALQSKGLAHQFHVAAKGVTRYGLSHDGIKSVWLALPPLAEQAAIARYLDDADRRIRRCIRAKEKLVELLEEQRQALVNEAVTGRVDVQTGQPYSAYKPSRVDWLGDVPTHWVVASLRHRYQQCLGKMLDSKRIKGEHLLPYLRNIDVQWGSVNVVDLPMMDILPIEIDRYTVQPGDLIVCEGGEVGRCAIWHGESGVLGYQKALHRLRPHRRDQDNPRFMYHTLRHAVASDAFSDGHESTIGHLTGDKLRAHRFPFPPLAEQAAIARYLDHADERIRRGIQSAQRQIDLLKEYRTRLVADVVTGKLDVREAAAELAGDLEEPESITGPDASAVMSGESSRSPNVAT